jgi:hypothetical protein
MDFKRIGILRDKAVSAKNFSEVFTYFFYNIGEDSEFIRICRRTSDPLLESCLTQSLQAFFKRPVEPENLLLMEVPAHGLIHGGFTVQGMLGNVLYFVDIQLGMIALASFTSPNTQVFRFSAKTLAVGEMPSMN